MVDLKDLVPMLLDANVLTTSLIQEVFVCAKSHYPIDSTQESWDKVAQILWAHLQSCVLKLDDQLLCATCFYTVVTLTGREEFYLKAVVQAVEKELDQRQNDVIINSKTTVVVSLMYGIFQSSFLTFPLREHDDYLKILLDITFDLLTQLAYDYSRNTFIVFKTISSFKKVFRTPLEVCIFNLRNQEKLLNLVNHNWENPITGVRDLNKVIFQTLVSLMDRTTFEKTLMEINGFYWNKAKYLMLSIMIAQYNKNIVDLVIKSDWLTGLSSSLHKPGLVSAGTDMYYAILKKLGSEDHWVKLFLPTVQNILLGTTTKAIENFINYWCMATLHKFPYLIKTFIQTCQSSEDIGKSMFNTLHVLKQGNRLRVIRRNFHATTDFNFVESMIFFGIENKDVHIRMASFEIVCDFQGLTKMPTEKEYNLVLNYLKCNINSDCAVLRHGMLNSLKTFLTQIHTAFMTNYSRDKAFDTENLNKFMKAVQGIVISNLNVKGNYQRKITSVKICGVIWESSINLPKKNKKNDESKLSKKTLLTMLIENQEWLLSDDTFIKKLISLLHDPSDDIRENTVQLLLNYYSSVFKQPELINFVLEEALKSIGGKFFYEISCGQSMFKLIANVLIKEKIKQATFQTLEDVFTFASNELINEHDLKTDILESIESGKQLHSFIDILIVVLEVQLSKSYTMTIPDRDILELLRILEDISTQFAWDENSSSSDFSQINDMVQQIIDQSGVSSIEDEDDTKISGIHQNVLNCIWLNVKACCDLASLMIRHCSHVTYIERFLLIITRVLESSRHKGAIEAAGAALGKAIQYLTSLPEDEDISDIPHELLKSKLKELITEASKMASTTRRGAGLSIMVHRIVTSDLKKGKPLFHYFMTMILETCSQSEDLPNELQENSDIDNEKDLPKAIYIHFLTRIAIDSSIASDVMYYSPQLARLAFDNLTNSHWQIRNAALQLYGALVPKLIGQKKASGTGEETIATVACDELRTHSPELWIYINEQLGKVDTTSDKVRSHSVQIPVLNMLANSAMRYNFSSDDTVHESSEYTLLQSLIALLDSPVMTVRRLAAKSIFNIYSLEVINDSLIKHDWATENCFHGVLILIAHCYKYYSKKVYSTLFDNLQAKIENRFSHTTHSYLCRELYEEIFANADDTNSILDNLKSTLIELDSNIYAPGIFSWANARFKNYVCNIAWEEVPTLVKIFLSRNEFELFCDILLQKLQSQTAIPKVPLCETSELLLACDFNLNNSGIWRILYEISQLTEINCCVDTLLEAVKTNYKSYKLRYMLPFAAKILSCKIDENNLAIFSNLILSLCDPETVDVDMRYTAALSNNELTTAFSSLPDTIKISTIKSAVILLQDEDEEVRNLSTICCKNMTKKNTLRHPYINLQLLMDPKFLRQALSEPESGIQILRKDLMAMLSKSSGQSGENYNPFANDSKNIYMEVDIFRKLIEDLI